MTAAEVGDDVYGEDPTVNPIGTEATPFVSSGTQSIFLALFSHCRRGDEYIVGQEAHCKGQGILLSGRGEFRLVTHLDITAEDVQKVIDEFRRFFI